MTSLQMLGYPASLAMGLALGLTGGGGSILTVPILVYLFGIGALVSTTYSLGLVGLVALWGAWGAFRNGELHLKRALSFGVPGVIGVLLSRRVFLPLLPQSLSFWGVSMTQNSLMLIAFSLLMLLASFSMIRASFKKQTSIITDQIEKNVSNIFLTLSGLATGILAGFVGAGGGFLIVPVLVNVGRLDMRQAVGTSLFVIALQSLIGVLGDYEALAKMDLLLFITIAVLALIGMSIGTKFRERISQSKLKLGFGIFVLMMGAAILFQELRRGSL
ncbi:MAG: sulfite exporter TauE/SafE family protein [Proteobacteria bacterium]|nr:sulfite exporter TauE/SafE family protein [Pseudomonadota bacterium]